MMIKIEQVPAHVVWPVRHRVMYPDKAFENIKLPDDEAGIHLTLVKVDAILCVISLFCNGNSIQFRKFATLPEFQGMGYGTQLLHYTIHYAKRQNIRRIWCNARRTAVGFYQKFGFRETEETFSRNDIDYVVMELVLEQP